MATVTSTWRRVESYVGLAKNVKNRYPKHKKNLLVETVVGNVTLSKYFWNLKNAGNDPNVTWRFLEKNIEI